MDFTRDPIIETVISPKDGFKLSIRSSRHTNQEEYLVNAIEVVSFGSALFLRSIEKPKSFLLPIADYEIVEVKEARMILKNVSIDKPIKIGEGKDNNKPSSEEKEGSKSESEMKKNSKKKSSRKRRAASKSENHLSEREEARKGYNSPKDSETSSSEEGGDPKDEAQVSSSPITPPAPIVPIVFPTPPKIIGRKLPTPEVQEVPKGDILSDELVSDNEAVTEVPEDDSHHEEEIANFDSPTDDESKSD